MANRRQSSWAGVPALAWIFFFLVVPLLGVITVSFLSRGDYGNLTRPFTAENYQRLAGFGLLGFDPVYPVILLRSLWMGLVTTVLCALVALPLAFFVRSLPARWREISLTLLVIPFWTNLLVRTYGWQIILGETGWATRLLRVVPGLDHIEALSPGPAAVYLCLVCDYLPFMVLPVYASVLKLDWSLVEAARDLGAAWRTRFRHAIWPQVRPGIFSGMVLVFLPAAGQFVIPDLLGGARTIMLGNVLQQQFGAARDWPFGAAVGVVFLGMMMLFWFLGRGRLGRSLAQMHAA